MAHSELAWAANWTGVGRHLDAVIAGRQFRGRHPPHHAVGHDPEEHLGACLNGDDIMESMLRAVASNILFRKTGDNESADRMRGLSAPGDEVAPSWLVDGSIEHSRVVHRPKGDLAFAAHVLN